MRVVLCPRLNVVGGQTSDCKGSFPGAELLGRRWEVQKYEICANSEATLAILDSCDCQKGWVDIPGGHTFDNEQPAPTFETMCTVKATGDCTSKDTTKSTREDCRTDVQSESL